MPFHDYFHETPIGQIVYNLSGGRLLRNPEESPSYARPDGKDSITQSRGPHQQSPERVTDSDAQTRVGTPGDDDKANGDEKTRTDAEKAAEAGFEKDADKSDVEKGSNEDSEEQKKADPFLIDWYGPNDPANPLNWSTAKKCFATANICFLTFSVYIGSAIITPGTMGIMEEFQVAQVVATLGLSMFVFGYAIGPMFLSPLSEIPAIGRNPPYIVSLLIFVALQAPTARAHNIGTIISLRFLAGFFGSPPLATGGATLADIFMPSKRAYSIGIWGMSAVSGPVLGPLAAGFAVQAEDWRWAIWILLWLSGGCLVFLLFFMPETSSTNILVRRARRIRKATGDDRYRSQGEIDSANFTPNEIAKMTLVRPFVIGFTDPIAFFLNAYIALVYSILYLWFESFAIVFGPMGYGFNLGENGLAFLGIFFGALITFVLFCVYLRVHLEPLFSKYGGTIPPEKRLPPAVPGGVALVICLFWFGWSANRTHWIVPIIGSGFFSVGAFLLFQCVLNYLGDAYPNYIASVFAGNDLFRSMAGGAFPLFAKPMYDAMGIDWACSMLGFVSAVMVFIPIVLIKYGERIRKASKWAT